MNLHSIAGFAALAVGSLTFAVLLKKQRGSDCPA